jgi:hypothetical protein
MGLALGLVHKHHLGLAVGVSWLFGQAAGWFTNTISFGPGPFRSGMQTRPLAAVGAGLAWPGPGGLAATTLTNMPYINTSKHVHALQREKKTIKRLTCLFYLFAQLQRSQ